MFQCVRKPVWTQQVGSGIGIQSELGFSVEHKPVITAG